MVAGDLMATAARKPCTWPGCPALVSDGNRCQAHKRQAEQQRGSAHERGYTTAWTKARAAYLCAHPLCKVCLPMAVAATVVDHIVAHKGDKALFWDSANNWQPLCKPCHDRKTATEDGGFGRAAAARYGRRP